MKLLGAYSKIRERSLIPLRINRRWRKNQPLSFLGSQPNKVFRIDADRVIVEHKNGEVEEFLTPEDPPRVIEDEMEKYQPIETPGMPPLLEELLAMWATNTSTMSALDSKPKDRPLCADSLLHDHRFGSDIRPRPKVLRSA